MPFGYFEGRDEFCREEKGETQPKVTISIARALIWKC